MPLSATKRKNSLRRAPLRALVAAHTQSKLDIVATVIWRNARSFSGIRNRLRAGRGDKMS